VRMFCSLSIVQVCEERLPVRRDKGERVLLHARSQDRQLQHRSLTLAHDQDPGRFHFSDIDELVADDGPVLLANLCHFGIVRVAPELVERMRCTCLPPVHRLDPSRLPSFPWLMLYSYS